MSILTALISAITSRLPTASSIILLIEMFSLLNSTQILLDNLNDNPDMEYATRKKFIYEALNQVNGMSWMIVSMLKLSRIDAGVVEFNNENISINKI